MVPSQVVLIAALRDLPIILESDRLGLEAAAPFVQDGVLALYEEDDVQDEGKLPVGEAEGKELVDGERGAVLEEESQDLISATHELVVILSK